ncbi:MAG: hydroxymethylglutaryl-CoA synthase [Kiritimatiellae bacterium]|nr:hydroxymethylglutaryl-CoA synthase [Kiritimatiellia bacterium]MDD4735303.1 hydroxymethylglutaryl-CoA synthase [Kiritimatiellia bacterium]
MKVGIEAISIYSPRYYLDLKSLAAVRGIDAEKYYKGLGQERMAVVPPDEDIVTMAANAVESALEGIDFRSVDTLMLATESGIDQSKAAAIYVHRLVGLPSTCKAYELKQACCAGTAGVLAALALVQQHPQKKVVVVASDIARYGLGTPGEPTTGAGAVALVISADPKLVELSPDVGAYTADVMDFWRPNYMDEALVDGKYSIRVYLKALAESWNAYVKETGLDFTDHYRFCYHLPFTRMAEKGHLHLAKYSAPEGMGREALLEQIYSAQRYNRLTGNLYAGSVYVALTSLLESQEKLENKRVGLFSYGSGCMGIFYGGVVQPGYKKHLKEEKHRQMLGNRTEMPYGDYEVMYKNSLPKDGSEYMNNHYHVGNYRLAGVKDHKRIYEAVEREEQAPRSAPAVNSRSAPSKRSVSYP